MTLSRCALLASLFCCLPLRPATPQRPNIIWIWADNLAFADLGIYGGPSARTPRIDGLARGGVRFTHYSVAHTVCSPSRAALLTGRQPFRSGIVDVLRPDSPIGIPDDEITLGEALRAQGYDTMAIGKWHLGDRRPYLPTRHGFDRYFGMPYSMDMAPSHVYRDEEIIEDLAGTKVENITERYTDEAIRFVAARRDRPFFLYLSHTLPHPPINLPPRARTPGASLYQDAIAHLDEQTGRLLDELERGGLIGNTLLFFSSDNGPMDAGGQTGVLRGRIRDAYEGGIRVPLIASWPGRLPLGRSVDTPAIAYDIFPTLLRVAGGRTDASRTYDGKDIWPLLSGEGDFVREAPFFWVYYDNVTTVREGSWKLHMAHRESPLPEPELYNVAADPGESRNLAADEPDVVVRLRRLAADFQRQIPKAWPLHYTVRDPRKLPSGIRRQ